MCRWQLQQCWVMAAAALYAQSAVQLTPEKPSVSIALTEQIRQHVPHVVEVPVVGVHNPSKVGISISVWLVGSRSSRSLIGSLSLFPADQPGVFRLRCEKAFAVTAKPSRVALELKPSIAGQPLTATVTIGELQWLSDVPK